MTPDEMRACITYANGIDPRVQMTAPNAQLWGRVVGAKSAAEVVAAIQVYYERPRLNGREHPTIDPASVKRIIAEETGRQSAVESAAKALPPARNPNSFRQRDPERWDALVAQGAAEYKAGLRARGMEPHADSCPSCQRKPKTI